MNSADLPFMPILPQVVLTLEEERAKALGYIDHITSSKILGKLPQHTQTNLLSRFVELITLGETATVEALAIQTKWDWVKSIRIANHTVVAAITIATSLPEIALLIQGYVDTLASM